MSPLPVRLNCGPLVEEWPACGRVVWRDRHVRESLRWNRALKASVASVCRLSGLSVAAVFESLSAVELSAVWKAVRAALARL